MDDEGFADDIQTAPPAGLAEEGPESRTRSAHARMSRKRTKTGCLTCRRRRIKCGEERPTCGNCIKSKRQCEGYNQRVIFKDPLSTIRVPSSTTQTNPHFNARPLSGVSSASQQSQFHSVQHTPQILQPNLAGNRNSSSQGQSGEPSDRRICEFLPIDDKEYGGTVSEAPRSSPPADTHYDTVEASYLPQNLGILNQQAPSKPGTHYDFTSLSTRGFELGTAKVDQSLKLNLSSGPSCASEPPLQELVYHSDIREAASAILTQSYQGSSDWPTYFAQHNPIPPKLNSYLHSRSTPINPDHEITRKPEDRLWKEANKVDKVSHEVSPPLDEQQPEPQKWVVREESSSSDAIQYHDPIPLDTKNANLVVSVRLDDQHMETSYPSEEDIFDKSDDEMGLDESDQDTLADFGRAQEDNLKNNDLGIFVALQVSQDMQEQRLRTYHSFLDGPNVLTSYQPSARSSPLTDSTTARIFYHYVNVTAPSISLYERHPANPSLMFQGRPVPRSQQHIWAYTMPTLALSNHALLHAMLAIGSLHIALLQDGPQTPNLMPSLKHYHIAIRRVAKSVRLPMRRGQPAILAATLLLGWYELMSGEHRRWCSHLLGATQLLKEIDFASITKFLKNRKLQQPRARYGNLYHHEMALGRFESHPEEQADFPQTSRHEDVNEGLVGMIMGKKLRYDEYGQVLEDFNAPGSQQKVYTQRELETYETQRDMFWWYCKQDAFQSILSGNRLFMQYDWWSHCPPRAAIGKRDATYGTFDHLILLLGRLAEFAAKDLKRKRKALQANGGQWRPPSAEPVEPGSAGQNAPHQSGPPQMPSFAGMMPGTEGKAKLPRGFSPRREDSPISEDDSRSLEDWTVEAEEEWHEIHTAFSILKEHFGPDFQPLGPEHCQLIESPFGPALQYRTYSISGIWIIYYMGLILCHRYRPTMPPAATMAAGFAAHQTGFYANEIGRISAAIAPDASQVTEVSTGVGAGLIECTFGLFIAGVQYQNLAQRSWLVQRCLDIARLTGWQIAKAIAMGCESAWTRAAEMGRGPPYTRRTERRIDQEDWYKKRKGTDPLSSGAQNRVKIFIARTDRVYYALGLLGVEQDLENLDFDDDDEGSAE